MFPNQFVNRSQNQQVEDDSDEESGEDEIIAAPKQRENDKVQNIGNSLNTTDSKQDCQDDSRAVKAGRLRAACTQESMVKTNEGDKVLGPPTPENLVEMLIFP